VDQKNLGLAASIVEWTLKHDPRAKFIILASATPGDPAGMADEAEFARLAYWYRNRVFFHNTFNLPLSKLILAGGDFCLIPSRFEPCGLVDYEASLLGNIVIGRATGGLTKVSHCAYLYDWLDISDRMGEAGAFFSRIATAIGNYRRHPEWHRTLIRTAMDIDASWDTSAAQYLRMYRYGFLMKQWHAERKRLIANFAGSLGEDLHTFSEFFIPGREVYGDAFDWQLRKALTAGTKV
jgi:starch synthase